MMIDIRKIFGMALPAAALSVGLAGCVHEEVAEPTGDGGEGQPVTVSAALDGGTRAFGSYWEKGDAIGVSASGGTASVSNRKFVSGITTGYASETSNFSAATNTGKDENIYFSNLSEWSFSAYYPYNADATETGTIDINLANDCTSKDLDILYASGAKATHAEGTKENPVVYFDGSGATGHGTKFRHVMSRVIIRVHVGAGVTDDEILGSSCRLASVYTKGTFSLSSGQVSAATGSFQMLDLVVDGDGQRGVSFGEKTGDFFQLTTIYVVPGFSALPLCSFQMKLPGWDAYKNATVRLTNGGFESGMSYEFDVTVSNPSLTVTGCKIENWTTGESLENSVY